MKSTRRWLENSVTRTYDDLESLPEEEEEEEEPDFDDIMFIDDRDDNRRRYAYFNDNDESPPSSPQPTTFTSRSRQRMPRIDDDEEDVPQQQQQRQDIPWPDTDDEGDDDDNDFLYNRSSNEDHDMPEYIKDMRDFDYRYNPPAPTVLSEEEQRLIDEDLVLLKQKGIYPYEYMDSLERFKEPTLPPIEAFKSSLTGEDISEKDYARAQRVFVHFQMHSLQDYHNLYLLQDVLLLNDVLLAFREVCLKTYQLDPCHYYTAPGLTWDAGLKYTGVTLDLLTDEDMFLFVEDGIRGGISMITKRHAKVNHPNLEDAGYYEKDKELCNLLYLDANNLYGWAMMQCLPTGNFKWMSATQIQTLMTLEKIRSIPADSKRGYILEVDMYLPEDCHEKLSDYPVAPEKKPVHGTQLSEYQRNILREEILSSMKTTPSQDDVEAKIDARKSCDKLILDYEPKRKYAVHYRNLQLYMQLGMKVTKIHRVLSFDQTPWLAKYIKKNTEMRTKASNEFEKDFFKLMNNAFFGKTMENVRARRNIDIINNDPQRLNRYTAKPTYKSYMEISDDIVAVERIKATVMLNKPIYLGLCVLDLSKVLMYDFFYNKLQQIFPNVELLFTDTDSLCVSIKNCEDVYARIRDGEIIGPTGERTQAIDEFDLSAYSSKHPIFDGMSPEAIKAQKNNNEKVKLVFVHFFSITHFLIYKSTI